MKWMGWSEADLDEADEHLVNVVIPDMIREENKRSER